MHTNLRGVLGRFVFCVALFSLLAACQQTITPITETTPNQTQITENVAIPIGDISPDVMADLHVTRLDNALVTAATGPNLLSNPSFENGTNSWTACDATSTIAPSGVSVSGLALSLSTGCMYQDVVVQPANTYTLSCKARLSNTTGWSGTGFGISNASFAAIAEAPENQITGSGWSTYTSTFTTPANSKYASIWFYTDGAILIDDCSFTQEIDTTEPPTPSNPNLLPNGSFDNQSSWLNCGNASAYTISGGNLNTNATACVYQTIDADVGGNYQLTCKSKANTGVYSSVTLSILNSSWAAIASDSKAVTPSSLRTITLAKVAPANAKYVAITFYSEGVSQHQDCVLTQEGITQPPVATVVNPVPTPNGTLFPYPASHPTDNEAALAANNLLINPTFANQTGWANCAPTSATMANGKLDIKPGVCFFQEVLAEVGQTYTLTCRGSMDLPIYSVFTLNMLDANFQSLASEAQTIHTSNRQWRLSLQAPTNTKFVTVGFYTESGANYDYCYLTKDLTL